MLITGTKFVETYAPVAAIRKIPVEELIKEVLQSDGYEESIELNGVDWSCLLDDYEPLVVEELSEPE